MPLISSWFVCKSCGSTFLCQNIDEFLDHKKEKHFSEFQKTNCIIFQELKNDGLLASATQQLDATLSYEQDGEYVVQLCSKKAGQAPGLRAGSGSSSRAESGNGTLPPEPEPEPEPPVFYEMYVAAYETQPLVQDQTDTIPNNEIPLVDIIQPETEAVDNFQVFSSEKSSDFISNTLPTATGSHKEILQNVNVEVDPGPILEKPDTDTCKNTIISPTSSKKGSLGTSAPKIRRRKKSSKIMLDSKPNSNSIKCSHVGCLRYFKDRSKLDRHETTSHENVKLKPKNPVSNKRPYFIFPQLQNNEATSTQTLREWLLEQKLAEKSNSSPTPTPTETETVNIIRLDPDPTETETVGKTTLKITPESPIKCKLCCKNLESEAEVRVHVLHCWLQNKRRHRHCVPCDKTFGQVKVFRKHNQKFHILGMVNKRGKKGVQEEITTSSMMLPRRFLCHLCPMRFKASFHLKRHVERHVPPEERAKPFVCEICGSAFSDNYSFKTHQSTVHSEVRPFPCPHFNCHAASKTKRDLHTHLRSHSETKPFSCPMEGCSKSYKTKAELGTHLKSVRHTGLSTPKSWKCEVESCKKMYSAKASLDKHMIVVHGASGEAPRFECDICKKVFSWKVSLLNHGRTHHALPE